MAIPKLVRLRGRNRLIQDRPEDPAPVSCLHGAGAGAWVSQTELRSPREDPGGAEQPSLPPRPGPGPHLDAEAELRGHPVQLAALRHHIRVGLADVRQVLQVPGVLLPRETRTWCGQTLPPHPPFTAQPSQLRRYRPERRGSAPGHRANRNRGRTRTQSPCLPHGRLLDRGYRLEVGWAGERSR